MTAPPIERRDRADDLKSVPPSNGRRRLPPPPISTRNKRPKPAETKQHEVAPEEESPIEAEQPAVHSEQVTTAERPIAPGHADAGNATAHADGGVPGGYGIGEATYAEHTYGVADQVGVDDAGVAGSEPRQAQAGPAQARAAGSGVSARAAGSGVSARAAGSGVSGDVEDRSLSTGTWQAAGLPSSPLADSTERLRPGRAPLPPGAATTPTGELAFGAVEKRVATPLPGVSRRLLVSRMVQVIGDGDETQIQVLPPRVRGLAGAIPNLARPRASLSLLWALVMVGGLFAGDVTLAFLLIPVTFVATASGLRYGRDPDAKAAAAADPQTNPAWAPERGASSKVTPAVPAPFRTWIAIAAALSPLFALGGPVLIVLYIAAVAGGVVYLADNVRFERKPALVLTLAPLLASSSAVLALREEGLTIASCLIFAVLLYDVAACLMGSGPGGGRLGLIAGLVTMFLFGFYVSALVVPPFRGISPWIMTLIVGLLASVGTHLVARYVRPGRAPALRRLDSLAVAGPIWVIIVMIGFGS